MLFRSLASSTIFFSVRRFGYKLIRRLFGEDKLKEFDFLSNTEKVEAVTFVLFLIPGTPKDMLTYLAGVSRIDVYKRQVGENSRLLIFL